MDLSCWKARLNKFVTELCYLLKHTMQVLNWRFGLSIRYNVTLYIGRNKRSRRRTRLSKVLSRPFYDALHFLCGKDFCHLQRAKYHRWKNPPVTSLFTLPKRFTLSVIYAHAKIPPPWDTPGICPIDSSRGSGICLSYMCTGAGYWRTPVIWQMVAKPSFRHACVRADRILRPRGQGGVKFIVRISEKNTLCHANLNTTIKGLCFIIFHSSLIL
jgi:hypothetical protein